MLFMQAFFYLNSSCQIVCVFVPVSKKRELPESIQNIWDRLTDSYHQGWKSVKPKSILDNSYRTMPCLFKECFSKEDDKYNCKWMELIVWFYICRTVEYWSAKHWLVKRPNKRRLLFFLNLEFLGGNDGTDLLIGVLRVWGKTVEVHLMIATTWKSLGNFGVQPQEGFFHQSTKFLLITSRNPKMYAHSSKKKLLLLVDACLWSKISLCEWEKLLGDWINIFIPSMMNETVAWFRLWGCLKDVKYLKKPTCFY